MKSIVLLFKRSKIAFSIFIAVQIIISIGFIFFYTTTFTARESYIKQYDSMRTIQVDINQSPSKKAAMDFVTKLQKNSSVSLDNIRFTFVLDSEQGKENARSFIAYLHPDMYKSRIIGRSIIQRYIDNQTLVLVSGNADSAGRQGAKQYKVGDTTDLDGISFHVIGFYNVYGALSEFGEIPYTDGLNRFTLTQIQLLMPADTTDNQKEQLGNYTQGLLPGCKIILPKPLTQKLLMNMLIPFATGLLVGIGALVNFLFIFKYMLESSREDYFILKICGCCGQKLFAVLFSGLVSLYTLCYTVGTLLFAGLRQLYKTISIFANSRLDISQVLLIYLVSILLIALIMVPYLINFRKQTVNSGGAL